jgi:signal transduction histidine kinase
MQTLEVSTEEINITSLAEEVIQLTSSQALAKKITLRNGIDKEVMVLAQEDMIGMVLRNLISNAIKFTPADGLVQIGVQDGDQTVEVYVEDSGVGIGAEALDKIALNDYFSTRGTRSEAGTGLGLMLCKEFLLKSGSALQISSEEGKGSRFSFRLKKV